MTNLMRLAHGKGGHSPTFPNLIQNGSLATDIDGWFPRTTGTTLAFNGGATHTPTGGSLSVAKSAGGAVVQFWPQALPGIFLDGLTELDAVAFAKSANTDVECIVQVNFYASPYVFTTLEVPGLGSSDPTSINGSTWTEIAVRGIPVPETATHALFTIHTTNNDGTPVLIDDVYLGPPGGDTPPYLDVNVVYAANRLANGDFETDTGAWSGYWATETVTHETGAPLAGTGSLKCVTTSDVDGQEGITAQQIAAGGSEDLRLSFKAKGIADMVAVADFLNVSGSTTVELWSGSFTNVTQTFTADFTTPADCYGMYLSIITDGVQTVTVYFDDIAIRVQP